MYHSDYDDLSKIESMVRGGGHREVIGGLWDQIGDHQLEFLIAQGMRPNHRLLDIGCGSLRLGTRAIPWLDAGCYFGTDISAALIEAGRERELDDDSRAKAPPENFSVNADFDFSFLDQPIDLAIAQSVFTHLPINHLRRCLANLAPHVSPGGRVFITYFLCPESEDLHAPRIQPPAGVVTHDYRDPYHYRVTDLAWAVDDAPWVFQNIGDWAHPRGQRIAVYHRR